MSRQQFGFVIGLLIAAVWAVAGFGAAAGAVLAGLVGWLAVRVIDGDLSVAGLADRASANRRRSPSS
ncbi:hypothetical protein ACIBF5_17660 [Micromonospora sp. NPDC050417]|uniref:hypothetical protein n=1 Tax=Micromonospora sp. NPDC050417 TaxID=3364280 RepID=UPI00378C2EA8